MLQNSHHHVLLISVCYQVKPRDLQTRQVFRVPKRRIRHLLTSLFFCCPVTNESFSFTKRGQARIQHEQWLSLEWIEEDIIVSTETHGIQSNLKGKIVPICDMQLAGEIHTCPAPSCTSQSTSSFCYYLSNLCTLKYLAKLQQIIDQILRSPTMGQGSASRQYLQHI